MLRVDCELRQIPPRGVNEVHDEKPASPKDKTDKLLAEIYRTLLSQAVEFEKKKKYRLESNAQASDEATEPPAQPTIMEQQPTLSVEQPNEQQNMSYFVPFSRLYEPFPLPEAFQLGRSLGRACLHWRFQRVRKHV